MERSNSVTRLAALALLTVVILGAIRRILRNRIERKGCPLPPGPTALPFLGSALSVDTKRPWLTFTDWQETYGDTIYIRLFDMDVIILNSTSVATELLDKRSQIYSDRPSFVISSAPFGFHFGFAPYGDYWRSCRRIFQQTFRADAALRFRPMQLRRARQFIVDMINNSNEYPSHMSTFSAAIALSAAYDYETRPRNDPMVSIIDNFHRAVIPEIAPEKVLLLKAFPFLLYIPDWLPGSWIKRDTKEAYECGKMLDTPYRYVLERMASKEHMNVSIVSDHITQPEESDGSYHIENETALKDTCATAVQQIVDKIPRLIDHVNQLIPTKAVVETTSSTLMVFTLAMVQNPHVWKRAQADIDAVVGTDRLPEFDDRPSLPYVDAIIREVMRWRPALPLGAPHVVTQSDIYNGHYVPNGAIVLINTWAISRDEVRYPNADEFMPERFLTAKGMLTNDDPSDFVFGFGRRICPGDHVADASVWSAVVTMLATLDFNLAQDADGNVITFEATFTSGTTNHPNPFPCRITPRPRVSKQMLEGLLIT